jgi:hypothetical protein
MSESSSEQLRALLKNAEFARTPLRPNGREGSADVPLDELASLISSLDIDLGTPLQSRSNGGRYHLYIYTYIYIFICVCMYTFV